MKKHLALLIALLCLLIACSAASAQADDGLKLRGYSETEGYQYIQVGYYPYYSDGTIAPVLWRVLDVNQSSVLLQSVYALDVFTGNKYTTPAEIYADFDEFYAHTTLFDRRSILINSVLSAEDLRDADFGFAVESGNSHSRSIKPTPYAASKDLPSEDGAIAYWTYDGGKVSKVTPAGSILPVSYTSTLAVVPTITLGMNDLKDLGMDKGSGTFDDPYASSSAELSLWLEKNLLIDIENGVTAKLLNNTNQYAPARTLKTYTGPGTDYYRTPVSQITTRTAEVSLLAKEGRWVMIEYKTGRQNDIKHKKTAWIHQNNLGNSSGMRKALEAVNVLPEFSLTGYTTEEVDIYEDFDMMLDPIYTLWPNQEIRFLGYVYVNGFSMAYIETEIYNQPARGFIPLSSIALDEYEIQHLLNAVGE